MISVYIKIATNNVLNIDSLSPVIIVIGIVSKQTVKKAGAKKLREK
jgi:hypothetical protein